jgi:hypothetical protein
VKSTSLRILPRAGSPWESDGAATGLLHYNGYAVLVSPSRIENMSSNRRV